MRSRKGLVRVTAALMLIVILLSAALYLTGWSASVLAKITGGKTIRDRLNEYGPAARDRLRPHFETARVSYPPRRLVLLGLEAEKRLEIYAAGSENEPQWIRSYPVLAASGNAGPKLKRDDRQVPEGFYKIESLNPNSRFHLALRVNYPNAFDRKMAEKDRRSDLGGDIMIHGSDQSVGCLAMGDEAAEDLFVLAAETGIENIEVILAPYDLRVEARSSPAHDTAVWIEQVYDQIQSRVSRLTPGK